MYPALAQDTTFGLARVDTDPSKLTGEQWLYVCGHYLPLPKEQKPFAAKCSGKFGKLFEVAKTKCATVGSGKSGTQALACQTVKTTVR